MMGGMMGGGGKSGPQMMFVDLLPDPTQKDGQRPKADVDQLAGRWREVREE